jgi:DNA-binding response OmpR family regulator
MCSWSSRKTLSGLTVKSNDANAGTALRIMMADDYLPDVVLVKEALRSNGICFQMDVCADGATAVRYVEDSEMHQWKPDLIILDLNISGFSGLDVLKEIRGRSLFDGTPVAMLTSSVSPGKRAQALQLKADIFLTKPSHLDEFLSGVGRALRQLLTSRSDRGTNRK